MFKLDLIYGFFHDFQCFHTLFKNKWCSQLWIWRFAPMYQKSFSWFFEPATLMIFLCMICMTGFLFNTSPIIHLTFRDCRGQCWKSSWVSKGSNLIRLWLFFILLLKSWRCLYSRLSDKVSQNGPLILTKFGLKSTLWRGYNVWI